MLQHISQHLRQHLSTFPAEDYLLFNNRRFLINPQNFYHLTPIPAPAPAPSPTIAFLDGGQAEIVNGGNFCLSFIRIAAQFFQGKEKKGLLKNEFYIFTKAVWRNDEVFYESSIFSLQKEKFVQEQDLTISSYDSSLRIGNERAPIIRVASMARRFAELAMARQVSAEVVVLDGTLDAAFTGEEKYLQQLPATVAALAKTSSLFTTSGNNPAVLLRKLAPAGCWSYFVENKNPHRPKGRGIFNVSDTPSDDGELIQNNPTTASGGVSETNKTYFVKLHPQAKHVFRFEGDKEMLPFLAEQSQDAVFLGYPYGLILADKLARVSNDERNSLRMNFLLRKENKEILEYLNATNAHEILDRLG